MSLLKNIDKTRQDIWDNLARHQREARKDQIVSTLTVIIVSAAIAAYAVFALVSIASLP